MADVAGPELPQAGDGVDDAVALAVLPFSMKRSQTDFFRVAARVLGLASCLSTVDR